MRAWYLIYSKQQQERIAEENLVRQNYDVYLPLLRRTRRRCGCRISVIEPMFPRYLFINLCDQLDDWGPVRSTRGVMHLIRFGSVPARLPNDFVDTLRRRENAEGTQVLPEPSISPGDPVRITDGSMAGYDAVFAAKSGKERVLLLLHIAGKEVRVQLPANQVERVGNRW